MSLGSQFTALSRTDPERSRVGLSAVAAQLLFPRIASMPRTPSPSSSSPSSRSPSPQRQPPVAPSKPVEPIDKYSLPSGVGRKRIYPDPPVSVSRQTSVDHVKDSESDVPTPKKDPAASTSTTGSSSRGRSVSRPSKECSSPLSTPAPKGTTTAKPSGEPTSRSTRTLPKSEPASAGPGVGEIPSESSHSQSEDVEVIKVVEATSKKPKVLHFPITGVQFSMTIHRPDEFTLCSCHVNCRCPALCNNHLVFPWTHRCTK